MPFLPNIWGQGAQLPVEHHCSCRNISASVLIPKKHFFVKKQRFFRLDSLADQTNPGQPPHLTVAIDGLLPLEELSGAQVYSQQRGSLLSGGWVSI